jgi:large subunit ribosomal protein L10
MKSKAQKQKDLDALTEQFKKAQAAMVVGFQKMTVAKDQELRNQLREAGVSYEVVKNTLARRAAEGTPFEAASEHFKGVTAVALSTGDPVGFVEAIASLPSKEELISKVMFLINCQAQRLVTVISAVPRNLAIVVKQIGEQKTA